MIQKIFLLLCFFFVFLELQAKSIVVTIGPLHTIVKDLVSGTDYRAELLLKTSDSPHNYRLNPSQISKLMAADLIIAVSDKFETFLKKVTHKKNMENKIFYAENHAKKILPIREDENFTHLHEEEEEETEDGHGGGDEEQDLHLWMSPENAKIFALDLTRHLSKMSLKNASRIKENSQKFLQKLMRKKKEIESRFQKNPPQKFMVFHDAYQYFEKSFAISAEGTVLRNPSVSFSGKRIKLINQKLRKKQITCIYYEPQFNPEIVKKFSKKFSLKLIALDPLGTGNTQDKNYTYFDFLDSLAESFLSCRS